MKKLLMLSAILFHVYLSSAQAYHPFLVDSAHWTIEEDYCVGGCDPANGPDAADCWVTRIYNFKLGGDTIVNSFVYQKLVQNIYTTVNTGNNGPCEWPMPPTVVTCGVVGLLWEDTTARKVYIHKTNYTTSTCWQYQDSLFFDFSLQIGDSMKFTATCLPAMYDSFYVVDSINYVGFNSGFPNYHQYPVKTWYLHSLQDTNVYEIANIELYESIGASVGFFGYRPGFEGPYSTRLNSYSIGTDSAAGFSCMNPTLGLTDLPAKDISIAVYPNPAKDILILDIMNMPSDGNLKFVVTNILGQDLSTQTINNAKTGVDISAFSSGIYLWHLLSDGNIIRSGKVVHD